MTVVCLLHPGQMGSSVGREAGRAGHEVRWVVDGRSEASRARAAEAGLVPYESLDDALTGCEAVVSVCPPAAAFGLATVVGSAARRTGFDGLYVDANAVSPATARAIAGTLRASGVTVVDGGLVGPPPDGPDRCRLFLSGGAGAPAAAALFDGSDLATVVVDGPVGAASAVKVAYAAWTKGSAALLLAVAAFAEAEGVTDPLVAEWNRSQPGLADRLALTAAGVGPKAWRFDGELTESGAAFGGIGLPDGFGAAAAEVYRRLSDFKDRPPPDLAAVLAALTPERPD